MFYLYFLLYGLVGSDGVALHVENLVNIVQDYNSEVAMRLVSDVTSGRTFYSDLNGLQVHICPNGINNPQQVLFLRPSPHLLFILDDTQRAVGKIAPSSALLSDAHDGWLRV